MSKKRPLVFAKLVWVERIAEELVVLVLVETVVELVVLTAELVVEVARLVDLDVSTDVDVAAPDRVSKKCNNLGAFLPGTH